MNCTVYHSKRYALAGLVFVLVFAAVCAWGFMPHQAMPRHFHGASHWTRWNFQGAFHGAPWLFRAAFAFLISVCLVGIIHALVSTKPVLVVDENGIQDLRARHPVIPWADVVAVHRPPKVQRQGNETHTYLRDAWRPIVVTVRNPDKHLYLVQKILRSRLPFLVNDPGQAAIPIEFMGLTPGSDIVEDCIRQHLARLGVPAPAAGGSSPR